MFIGLNTADYYDKQIFAVAHRIGQAVNSEIFKKLNSKTNNTRTYPIVIETILRNFEDGIIDEDQFVDVLKQFNKTPHDFGYDFCLSEEDRIDYENYFKAEGK